MPVGEDQFLEEIGKAEDRTVRLVYADWLDEQGDPRGELVRIEEEMRGIPIYSDRYWELKPHRNQLRADCPNEWLAQMEYGTVYEPTFRDIPDGWKERWRLIREFTERWYGIPMPDVGYDEEKIFPDFRWSSISDKPAPPSMLEWIAYANDIPSQERNLLGGFWNCFPRRAIVNDKELPGFTILERVGIDIEFMVHENWLEDPDPPVHEFWGYPADQEEQLEYFLEEETIDQFS
ncbi:MAG: TIGR02996 domain-containing protein, partial [Planctomycetaceae bacterium]|nr:TIGR02996 domain-containing protein [Planctomycetaceae bacterium]